MASNSRPHAVVVVMRPVLKIAGGHITVSHLEPGGAETRVDRIAVAGGPDHDWPELYDHIEQELAAGRRRFVLDLDRVPWINSRGLGRLIELLQRIEGAGGRLALVCNSERIRNILAISQIDEILRPLDGMDQALDSFAG